MAGPPGNILVEVGAGVSPHPPQQFYLFSRRRREKSSGCNIPKTLGKSYHCLTNIPGNQYSRYKQYFGGKSFQQFSKLPESDGECVRGESIPDP